MTTVPLSRSTWQALALTLLIALAPATKAADIKDPPTRAGRVVTVIGDAWLFDHDSREWTRLQRNQTVAEGDRVRTDERARVSLRVGSTSLWVDERSDIELSQLDEGQTLLSIDRGDVALRLRSGELAAETRLRTREGTVSPEREGLYRVEQLDRGTKIYSWQGRMRFDWQRSQEAAPVWLNEGEQAEMWWPGGPRTERSRLYSDSFGDWVLAESRADGDRPVARYVSPEMTGAEELDRHGRWESSPEYGNVWIPTVVVAGWAPYRYGNWVWSRHWGWTWVDDAPWGFAPFHYGRWVSWGGRWCWTPGAYVHRPVYAPALVGWVGAPVAPGVSIGVTIGIGNRPPPPRYGWYPLAPREVFVPGYAHSPRYDYRVNDRPDWRNARDPITVPRPQHRYRDDAAAVSFVPQQGAPIQALPAKPDAGWAQARPLPSAPARDELRSVLPVRVPEAGNGLTQPRGERGGEPRQAWRSEQLPLRRDRAAEAPQASQAPQVQAQPQVQPQPGAPAQADLPWRQQAREERREQRQDWPAAQRAPQVQPQVQVQQEPARGFPMPERQVSRPVIEAPQMQSAPQRQFEPQQQQHQQQRPAFEVPVARQAEMPRAQMPAPAPQAQPQPRPQRAEEAGPQRKHDGRPGRERENER